MRSVANDAKLVDFVGLCRLGDFPAELIVGCEPIKFKKGSSCAMLQDLSKFMAG